MRKTAVGILLAIAFVTLTVGVASALPTNRGIDKAKEVSPAIDDDTGELKAPPEFVADLPESELTKIVFIRYAPGKEPPATCGNEVCEPKENWKSCPSDCTKGGEEEEPTTACYDFLTGSKPKWSWVEDYYYSDDGLGATSTWATVTWNEATSATIFGDGVSEALTWGIYDYKNSVSYGDYDDPGVIAVTAIWFRGKNIYEYDIMFDTDYFSGDGLVDLATVVLHEFGHGAGLGDLYSTDCVSEVMYGIYDEVDLDLGPDDITGIQKLYGK